MRRIFSEILTYVNTDLWERHASRVIPALSRRELFKKPRNWKKVFHLPDHVADGSQGEHFSLNDCISRAQDALLAKQDPREGFWCSPLRADTTVESDTIMLWHFLDQANSPKIKRLARYILSQQNSDGGWSIYRNGPSELSATVKAYWALKLAGHTPDETQLARARERISALGGIHKINSFSKAYLAIFNQYDWKGVPAIPPELMLFPKWFYFNIYEMSSWTRAIVIPLSIIWAKKPKGKVPAGADISELFPDERRYVPISEVVKKESGWLNWQKFFLGWDSSLKNLEGRGPHWIREWSLKLAQKWILERLEKSDGLGAIYPGIVNTIVALKAMGYSNEHPLLKKQIHEIEKLEIDRGEEGLEIQPCFSPIWDTAISMIALSESGLRRDHPSLVNATEWFIDKEIKERGDWAVKNPTGPVGGWAFEFANEWYPDIDDTAMVLLALRLVHLKDNFSIEREKTYLRGLNWLLSMQCASGGWGAFDVDNTKLIFTKIPFADHNAMVDPPTSDVTARVLELLGCIGYDRSHACARRAVEFLRKEQEEDGSWYGRWGVNYIYGTWQVLRGLSAIGEDMNQPYIQKAVEWFKSIQNPDGGWGERCNTYEDPTQKGKGPSTPSQTAWGLMGLMASGLLRDHAVTQAVDYLLKTQNLDGTWNEDEFTGTGFPKVFYLEYTLYRDYFPLMGLGIYRKLLRERYVRRFVKATSSMASQKDSEPLLQKGEPVFMSGIEGEN